ncbi:MAG: tetratricopeptide repeat protein [Bacteroidota bacterium]
MRHFILAFLLLPLFLNAQSLKQEADDFYNNQQWSKATTVYKKYLKKNKTDSSAWYNLAVAQTKLENFDNAIEAFGKAKETNFPPSFVYFSLSKAYFLNGDKDKAFNTLSEGANNGLAALAQIKSDNVFATYISDTKFKEILDQVERNAYPCLSAKNYRHFDFWLGVWDVYVGQNKVGTNSITMAQGGCAIHENYTTVGNYAGQSINFYDPIDKKWHQHWVGSGGDVYNYLETKREEGMLQFESKFMNPQGQISLSKLTFTLNEDGTVRQLFESSTDDGKTWTSAFDGLYKQVKKN